MLVRSHVLGTPETTEPVETPMLENANTVDTPTTRFDAVHNVPYRITERQSLAGVAHHGRLGWKL